jgi:hypothetical protein
MPRFHLVETVVLTITRHPEGPLQVAVDRQTFLDAKASYYG